MDTIVDLHNHSLPGVDDGARDLATAVEMVRRARSEGVARLVCTPHTLDGTFDVSRGAAREAGSRLRRAVAEAGIDIEIRVAGEVRFHEQIPELLADNPDVTLDGLGRYVLLELPHACVPSGFEDLLFRLKCRGTTALVAHPERNRGVRAQPRIVEEWVRLGALLQLTAGSLDGTFGPVIGKSARELLSLGCVHVVATDAHDQSKRPPRTREAIEFLEKEIGASETRRLFVDNPGAIYESAPAEEVQPVSGRRRRSGLRALFGR